MRKLMHDFIDECPVIDQHAHLVATKATNTVDLGCILSESGEPNVTSLAYKRGMNMLAEFYQCRVDGIVQARERYTDEELCERVLKESKVAAVLIDDGYRVPGNVYLDMLSSTEPRAWKILRIESMVEQLAAEMVNSQTRTESAFLSACMTRLYIVPPNVVGYKSIAAYRTGLDIDPHVTREAFDAAVKEWFQYLKAHPEQPPRLVSKAIIDYVLVKVVIAVASKSGLPIQFHTGFGDADLDLIKANPAYLQPLLKLIPSSVNIVLLHTSYPYCREAGYLASLYKNVYVDVGLAFPLLSEKGQQKALEQLFELAPTDQILFSTDAHDYADMFWLATKQFREAFKALLRESVESNTVTVQEAKEIAGNVLFNNANRLYKLKLDHVYHAFTATLTTTGQAKVQNIRDKGVQFVRLLWWDLSCQRRCRIVPIDTFIAWKDQQGIAITASCMAMLFQWDGIAPNCNVTATGEVQLVPVTSTLRQLPYHPLHAACVTNLLDQNAPLDGTCLACWAQCPRSFLHRQINALQSEHGLRVQCGFEIEFCLQTTDATGKRIPIDHSTYCSTQSLQPSAVAYMDDVVLALQAQGIGLVQYHAESANGQFELALVHKDVLSATDDLLLARETLWHMARKHNLHISLVPKPYPDQAGSACHVHLSITRNGQNVLFHPRAHTKLHHHDLYDDLTPQGSSFMAGILNHLPGLVACTMPTTNSYDRMVERCWAGVFQCWGVQNRECPLRLVPTNFELKAMDNTCNPYVALGAIIAAGRDGLNQGMQLGPPVEGDPVDGQDVGDRLPTTLRMALDALEQDKVIKDAMGNNKST